MGVGIKNQTTQELQIHSANGKRMQFGYAQFDGTDVTGVISARMKRVESIQLTPLTAGAPVAGDVLACANAAVMVSGAVHVPAAGLTIDRAANTTADLAFSYLLIGY